MAQYTSNYNLSKPENTDTNASFISAYRDNMDIIDKQMGNKNIAEDYDNTQTYAVDDYVIYDGDLYKCTTAVTTAEDFDSTKWTQTVASDEFGSGGGGGSSTLAGLSDVNLTTPSNGQVLKYNSTSQKWENGTGGGSANIEELTQTEYDLLPDTKYSDDVVRFAYSTNQILDPDYTYHKYGDNDEIVVRVYHEGESDQSILWFFRGWNQTSGDVAIPSTLTAYKPTTTSPVFSANYPNGGTTQDGWIGFYNNNIRAWNQSTSQTATGIMYGVVDIVGGQSQTNPYVDDPYIYITDPSNPPTRRIYLNTREYAEFNGGGGVIYLPTIYSEEEKEVGVWTDGKPLYQITVDQTIGSDADYTVFASGIDHAHLVNSKVEYSSGRWMSDNYISLGSASNTRACYAEVNNGALTFHNQSGSQKRWIATIQYTKTADVAGSGTWNGQGDIAHHYSTNETVIGTWIDGKTLCEKVITGISSYQYPSLMDLGIPISETIVKAEMQGITTISGTDYVVSGSTFLWSIAQGQNNGAVYISKGTTNYEAYFNGASTSDVNLIIQYTKSS